MVSGHHGPFRRRGWNHPAWAFFQLSGQTGPHTNSSECREKAGHLFPPRQPGMEPSRSSGLPKPQSGIARHLSLTASRVTE